MRNPDPISLWQEAMEGVSETAPSLAGEVEADVAVVGAGYTGLSAAIALRAAGLSVVVLEREVAGFGASGRNAGHLTPVIGKDLPTLAWLFGRERGRALIQVAARAIEHVEQALARFAIDCAYEPVGNLMAAIHPRQYHALDRAAHAGAVLGLEGELIEPEEMRQRGLPDAFTRAYLMRRGGILHPGRYVRGLRRAALEAGSMLFERTPVIEFEDGEPAILATPSGRVRARNVVIGTNAYTGDLGWRSLSNPVTRLHVYLFATEPLSGGQLAAIDWRGREGIYTAHEMLESYRLTPDNRIVGGAKRVRYGFGGRSLDDHPATFRFLESTFRDRFPELREARITHRWGGPIAFALDFLPALGRAGKRGNLFYSLGYAGHGVALASYAGPMLADLMLGREGPGKALWQRRRIPLPPEPFRWLVVRALTGVFGVIDERVDRAARRTRRP